jgi:flavin reductase (DIM6/NTAB) family NADH-FMN oxidoreductase RutF
VPREKRKHKPAAMAPGSEPFDSCDFRRALGQFATGVTVVTARGKNGRPIGLTVNSFASVSLDPPLVLWSLSREASDFADFTAANHFVINILGAAQHHLSRQFATLFSEHKFVGVECTEGKAGCPMLQGATAHFICRKKRKIEAGDHVIFLGQVEEYRWNDGKPLVFHAGRYHVTTEHPDLQGRS